MRLFTAIELPENIKNYLSETQQKLKQFCPNANYSHKQNLHITLVFIGECDVSQLPKINDGIEKICRNHESFKISLNNLGSFPPKNNSDGYIVWTDILPNSNLNDLRNDLTEELFIINILKEKEKRGYKPHLTLSREFKTTEPVKSIFSEIDFSVNQPISVNEIILFQSVYQNNKLTYKNLSSYPLKNGTN